MSDDENEELDQMIREDLANQRQLEREADLQIAAHFITDEEFEILCNGFC